MIEHERNETTATRKIKRFWTDEFVWLVPAMACAIVIQYFYLQSHPYPSFGAGLYLEIVEQISQNGYVPPETIPNYTKEGVPFAYPPLMFYVLAVLRDAFGFDPITLSRLLPGIVTILYLVPCFLLGRALLGSRAQAGFACLIVAVTPPIIQWHISAGGIVRAPGFLFALSGIYTGLKLFRTGNERWIPFSLGFFSLTILTHPVYTMFFVVSYLLMYAFFDRSLVGLGRGALVGFGGVFLTAPWWLFVLSAHGPSVFLAASGTHGGIGGGIESLTQIAVSNFGDTVVLSLWLLLPILGVLHMLSERRFFLPAWVLTAGVLLSEARYVYFIGAFIFAAFVFEGVIPFLKRERNAPVDARNVATFSVVLIAMFGLGAGTMYATSDLNSHSGSSSLPQFIDADDVEAMEWTRANTDADATFVVLGDAAEWFPFETERTMLVGPWGVEWESSAKYQRQLRQYRQLSTCKSADCLTTTLDRANVRPNYVYVPKGQYTVRGMEKQQSGMMRLLLMRSSRYSLAYENDGVMIFRVTR